MKNIMFYLKFAIVLAIIGWIAKAWAVPPHIKSEVMNGTQGIHQGMCIFQTVEMPCQIYYRESDDTIYLVLYTNDTKSVIKVVKVKDKKEETIWLNPKFNT